MTPISLEITNFRSFKATQLFTFPQEPGLYFMQGDNKVDERLGGNGAGKSTIWEALHWLIYGKTSKGLKAGQVCNWSVSKGVSVCLHYRTGNTEFFVTRTWGPISWTLEMVEDDVHTASTDLTQDPDNPFLAELRVGLETYQQSVMMAQRTEMFLDLKPEAQATLFGSVLGLDKWLDYSARASRKANAVDMECRRLEAEVAELRGKLSNQQDYRDDVSRFEARRKDRLASVESEYNRMLSKRKKIAASYERHKEDVDHECAGLAKAVKEHEARRFEQEGMRDRAEELNIVAAALRAELNHVEDGIKFLEEHTHCPTCDLDLDKDVRRRAIAEKREASAMIVGKLTKSTEEMRDFKKLLDSINAAVARSLALETQWADRVRDSKQDVKNAKRDLDDVDHALKRLEDEADAIENEVNPYKELQNKAREATRTAQGRFSAAERALGAANELQSRYAFWVKGFKDIRLAQIADALTELEIEVNSELSALGLPGWELLFSVDKEVNNGKSVSRGFNVAVISPQNAKPVPWESWSGGEHQRLRLAGQMGLSNLVRTRMGVTLDFEVWDEPGRGLTQGGVQDLLHALQRRAQIEQRQIWLVDHMSHHFGGFAGGVTIVKDKAGSRIVQS